MAGRLKPRSTWANRATTKEKKQSRAKAIRCPACRKRGIPLADIPKVPVGEVCHECYCRSLGVEAGAFLPSLQDAFFEQYLI